MVVDFLGIEVVPMLLASVCQILDGWCKICTTSGSWTNVTIASRSSLESLLKVAATTTREQIVQEVG
jgi:hypothetical protein